MIFNQDNSAMTAQVWEIRRDNLQKLIDSFADNPGNRAAFCRKYGLDPLQIGQYFTASKNSRKMGERKAREIEEKIGTLPTGWLDTKHSTLSINQDQAQYNASEAENVEPLPMGMQRIPLISFVQAGAMAEAADPYAVGSAAEWLLVANLYSESTFALEVKGESMMPDFREGDRIIIDPAIEPMPGDYVIAKNGENEATFKQYRPRRTDEHGNTVFELAPLNENYPVIQSDITPVTIIGVMVEHHRYRKR